MAAAQPAFDALAPPGLDIDPAAAMASWRHGSVVRSWLLDLLVSALFSRFTSRQEDSPAMKVVAALRRQFGGHATTPP